MINMTMMAVLTWPDKALSELRLFPDVDIGGPHFGYYIQKILKNSNSLRSTNRYILQYISKGLGLLKTKLRIGKHPPGLTQPTGNNQV
jgi:hypothetical protein